MIKDVSRQYAAFFAEAKEEEEKYSNACTEACREAEELKKQEIDEMDEEEIRPEDCGFTEADIQVDEVVDPMQLWKDAKAKDKKQELVKVDNNYINMMKKLLSGIRTSKKAVYDRICGSDGKLQQYMKAGTMLPPPEDFAENFVSFEEISKVMSKFKGGKEDNQSHDSEADTEGTESKEIDVDNRAAEEFKDVGDADSDFGTFTDRFGKDAEDNLYDCELTEEEEEEAKKKAKDSLDKAKAEVKDVDAEKASEFLKKNGDKLKDAISKVKNEKTKDDLKKIVKAVEKYSKGELDESMIAEAEPSKKGGKAKETAKKIKESSVSQFIKASLRLLTWFLMIVPMGLLGSAWVLKGLGTATHGLLKKMNKGLKESLELEVADDEEYEANEDEEELDETGCRAKAKEDFNEGEEEDVQEAACCVDDDPASHLLDGVGVKASTANLVGNDAAAISVVERLLSKIDKLESKIEILESRAEKNSDDATSSKSVNESESKLMFASDFIEVINKLLDKGEISEDSPVRIFAKTYGNFGLGGISKKANMFAIWFDTDYRYDGLLMNVGEMLERFESKKVNYKDVVGGSCDPNGCDKLSNPNELWKIMDIKAKNDVLVISFDFPENVHRRLTTESEEVEVTSDDIENSKMKFISGLDKLSKEETKKIFDQLADRIETSLQNQKRVNPDPSIKHTQQEINNAVKKINFYRKLSYAQELNDQQKKDFADLVYKYWYDWVCVDKKDEEGETYSEPLISVKDMLTQPFKSFFGRPGDKIPFSEEFIVQDNGQYYTLQNFNYTLDVDDYKQRKSIAKRKQRLDAKAKRDLADKGKGFVPKRGQAGTWSIADWNTMIGSLSDSRRKEIKAQIIADINDELKNNPQQRANEIALIQSLFNRTSKVIDINKTNMSNAKSINKTKLKQLNALKSKIEKEIAELDEQVEKLEIAVNTAKEKLDADPDNEDLDVEYDNAKFDHDEAEREMWEKIEELRDIAEHADEYLEQMNIPDNDYQEDSSPGSVIGADGNLHTQDMGKEGSISAKYYADMWGVSPQAARKFARSTIDMILLAMSQATGVKDPNMLKKSLSDMTPQQWNTFIKILGEYSDKRVRGKILANGDTTEDVSGILSLFDKAITDDIMTGDIEMDDDMLKRMQMKNTPRVQHKPVSKPQVIHKKRPAKL